MLLDKKVVECNYKVSKIKAKSAVLVRLGASTHGMYMIITSKEGVGTT